MNATRTRKIRRPRGIWIWIALVPVLILGAFVSFYGLKEWRASRVYQSLLADLRKQGLPVDQVSLANWYRDRTHPEGTERWLKILHMLNARNDSNSSSLPILGEPPLPLVLDPKALWKERDEVKNFLENLEVVREEIRLAIKAPTPVRLPMEFQGVDTLLPFIQDSRGVSRFLQLDFEYAYYTQDTKRAMEDLHLMDGSIKAFDSDLYIVGRLVSNALFRVRNDTIRRSLVLPQWSEEELDELLELVSEPFYSSEAMQEVLVAERTFLLDLINGKSDPSAPGAAAFYSIPSVKLDGLRHYDRLLELGSVPLDRSLAWARSFENESPAHSVAFSMLLPAIRSFSESEVRCENSRCWTKTAVALQLYQKREGSFPAKLSDLSDVGLAATDYSLVNGVPFGYEIEDGIAYLWSSNFEKGDVENVSPTRPVRTQQDQGEDAAPDSMPSNLIEIR